MLGRVKIQEMLSTGSCIIHRELHVRTESIRRRFWSHNFYEHSVFLREDEIFSESKWKIILFLHNLLRFRGHFLKVSECHFWCKKWDIIFAAFVSTRRV